MKFASGGVCIFSCKSSGLLADRLRHAKFDLTSAKIRSLKSEFTPLASAKIYLNLLTQSPILVCTFTSMILSQPKSKTNSLVSLKFSSNALPSLARASFSGIFYTTFHSYSYMALYMGSLFSPFYSFRYFYEIFVFFTDANLGYSSWIIAYGFTPPPGAPTSIYLHTPKLHAVF